MSNYPASSVDWKLYTVGDESHPVTLEPLTWNIRRTRGEPIAWSMTLCDQGGDLLPGGTLWDFLQCDPYDAAGNLRRYLICVITVGEDVWTSPKLIHLNYKTDVTPTSVLVSLSGNDQTEVLLAPDQYMADVRSTVGTPVYAHATITAILTHYNLASYRYEFDDFIIPLLHRVGTPLDWIRDILAVRQAYFWWDEDTFVCTAGGVDVPESASDYALDALKVFAYQRSAAGVDNEVTVIRTAENRSGVTEPITGSGIGFVTVPLATPLNYASARIELFAPGFDHSHVWDDAGGTPLTTSPTRVYYGATKAAQMRMILEPPSGGTDPIPYKVRITGYEHNTDIGAFEEILPQTYSDTADQAVRGRRSRKQPITSAMTPDNATALDYATRWTREGLRKYCTASVEALLHPLRRPGQIALVSVSVLGLSNYKMMTETVDFKGTQTSLLMGVELSRGAA